MNDPDPLTWDSPMWSPLPDGSVRHWSPFTDQEIWSNPERRHRPHPGKKRARPAPIDPDRIDSACAFCPDCYDRTPPEKSRLIRTAEGYLKRDRMPARDLFRDRAAFRRVANLFEIVSYAFWKANHGYRPPEEIGRWFSSYLGDRDGEEHLRKIVAHKLECMGEEHESLSADRLREIAEPFFGGCHDLILAERHFRPGAETTDDLASSGTLTPDEHFAYVRFTLEAATEIADQNPHVRHVAIFQNWRRRAGASFDHLHKQLLALPDWGHLLARKVAVLKREPNAFNRYGLNFALDNRLVIAANRGAVAYADVGQPYPTITIVSLQEETDLSRIPLPAIRHFSDLVHACHHAMGSGIPCNEEWQNRPRDCDEKIPLHLHLKWRTQTPAGFEGATQLHAGTMLPSILTERMIRELEKALETGDIVPLSVGEACDLAEDAIGRTEQ